MKLGRTQRTLSWAEEVQEFRIKRGCYLNMQNRSSGYMQKKALMSRDNCLLSEIRNIQVALVIQRSPIRLTCLSFGVSRLPYMDPRVARELTDLRAAEAGAVNAAQ